MEEFSLIKKFAENCTAYPNHTAIIDVAKDTSLTYHELDVASGKVYRYLTERGIGKEDVVMILLPRGAKPFVTLVGVWKAGAAYVMLETNYPEKKREFIKRDANCKLVIDENVFEEMMKCEVLEGYKVANPHDLSYIVYTSGTTGNPKGVMHEYGTQFLAVKSWQHKGVATFNHDDRVVQLTPLNFTATVILFHAVIDVAASLIVITLETMKNTNILVDIMDKYQITTGFFTPSLIRVMPKLPKSIKKLVMGGEPANGLFLEGIDSYNMYALSESGLVLLAFLLDKSYETVPSGRATIEEANVCLMNENGFPVEDGEVGEICYRNPYFRGYLNLSERNADIFRNGYVRSGDMAKILPDGNFLILGRSDDMVKINGNRVEPAEIEVAVKEVLGTEWVGVKVFTEGKNNFVCAYYIDEPVLPIEEAKKIISEKLVPYMVPAFYIKIDKIPVSSNGKFKRNDLPAPDFKSYFKDYVAPSNEMEEKLCSAIASVLGIERIGVEDDFYEIGGDSISSIQVITKLNLDQLDVNIFLAGRTPKKIAELYEKATNGKTESLAERNARAPKQNLPLSAEQIFMFDYQCYYPDSTVWNMPVLLKFGRDTDMERLKKAVDTVLAAHPIFSSVYAFSKTAELVQNYDKDKVFDIKLEEISEADFVDESEQLVKPFVLLNKSLYRIRLFKTEIGGYLFFDLHNSVADGTSLHILIEDISRAYDGKPLEPNYYFAALEDRAKQINSPLYEEAREYYKKTFDGINWDICLAQDFETKENRYANMEVMIPLDEQSYEKMHKQYGVGKNSFFIAVACIAIATYNGTKNIRVSWVHNGRAMLSEKHVIAAFLRDLYVGICFDEKITLANLYKNVAEQVNNDIRYLCYPYPGPEHFCEDSDDASVLYQGNLRNICAEGSLQFTIAKIPTETDCANNLLNMEIHETDEGCKLYMDYNACAYKEETIYNFRKMFIKTACLLTQNADNPDMHVMDIMKRIK
ncbi:MAG: non-ribosomal peptide synthetase [Synergistaceae bacterium]|nr:non-ribosomal peptide synthetase [Synergistaceae bacterium]